jgi:alpha-glucosidase
VLRDGATERGVYLPAGDWYDYWSGEHHVGPKGVNLPVTLSTIPIFVRGGAFLFTQPVVQHTGEMPGQPLIVTAFPSASSERWLYEDAGNGFGTSVRRKFSARRDGSATTIEVGAPEGSYRPQARSIIFTVRTIARAVSVNGTPLAAADWSTKDGVVTIKMPDRFDRMEIRIE